MLRVKKSPPRLGEGIEEVSLRQRGPEAVTELTEV